MKLVLLALALCVASVSAGQTFAQVFKETDCSGTPFVSIEATDAQCTCNPIKDNFYAGDGVCNGYMKLSTADKSLNLYTDNTCTTSTGTLTTYSASGACTAIETDGYKQRATAASAISDYAAVCGATSCTCGLDNNCPTSGAGEFPVTTLFVACRQYSRKFRALTRCLQRRTCPSALRRSSLRSS